MSKTTWSGVFPACTTQIAADQSLDVAGTRRHVEDLIRAGVNGLIMLGTLGENTSLDPEEKLDVIRIAKDAAKGRVPILSGVCETSTRQACRYAEKAAKAGADGFMMLPTIPYRADLPESIAHVRAVARATPLPIMIYNNPIHYGVDMTPEAFAELGDEPTLVAIKESSSIPSRITDLINLTGDRYVLFTGVDHVSLESMFLGAKGYVCGLVNAFPDETVLLWRLAQEKRWEEAIALYRWFTPVLKLDDGPKVVQVMKTTQALAGRGTEHIRLPRKPLSGAERERVARVMAVALATRPKLAAAAQ